MSPMTKIVLFFFVLLFICLLVYVLVVRAFYWGDRKQPPDVKDKEMRSGRDEKKR